MEISSRNQILIQLKEILFETTRGCDVKIYLFGSQAHGEEKRSSDIDIAIDPLSKMPLKLWMEIGERLDESTIPYRVDVVDLSKANDTLIEKVKSEGIKWEV